ncbi:helix-turn-helix domain-containing protein [Agarivorans albus]
MKPTTAITIVRYPGASQAAIFGLQEMFLLANSTSQQQQYNHHFECNIVEHGELTAQASCLQAVIVPPSINHDYYLSPTPELLQWLKLQHKQGCVVSSACAGAFILAKANLLNQRPVTTHWALAADFAKRFPDCLLRSEQIIINDGDIITAGGLMSWVDLGLELVAQYTRPSIMRQLGKSLVVDTGPREQRYYQSFNPNFEHGDNDIIKVQHFIQSHYQQNINVALLCEQCFLTERTLLRRFVKATGLKPIQYLQKLRVQKACELLETSPQSTEAIAQQVGYEDAGAFRKVFIKIIGLSPRDFRRRFTK